MQNETVVEDKAHLTPFIQHRRTSESATLCHFQSFRGCAHTHTQMFHLRTQLQRHCVDIKA